MPEYLQSISIEFIAAFLGFLFALLLDNLMDRRNKKGKMKLVLENVVNELKDIRSGLSGYVENGRPVSFRIQIPSWDALQYSGLTLALIDVPYYQELISTYALIQTCNDMILFRESKSLTMEETIGITDSIDALLKRMEGDKK